MVVRCCIMGASDWRREMTTRYIVRDRDTQGIDFLLWGDDDKAAAEQSLRDAIADGLDVELVTMPSDAMDPHTKRLIDG